ncbi:MAG: response regulator [Actinomycetota bacterium]|nr:response regulator [Actinomycetota bacterium]
MSVVLVVDDEPAMGKLVELSLADLGPKVIQARNGREALELARSESPNLVLLDLALDGEDGLALLPHLKAVREGMPCIVFTVHDSRASEAKRSGAAGFVAKPFRSETLRKVVQKHLS